LALTGLAQVAGWIVLSTMLAERTSAGQGTTMTLNGSFLGVGGALGAAAGGVLIDTAGYTTFGALMLLAAMASALLGWRGYRLDATPAVYNVDAVTVAGEKRGIDDGRDNAPPNDG
jgi:predicted MFS family arabinose efflux permease